MAGAGTIGKEPTGIIRFLQPHEIKVRVQSITKTKKAICLLYTDARVVMDILDEAYGPMNWQRKHKMVGDELYGIIEVWDKDKKEWISKEDVGTESNTEATKGQASDAAKRAAVNWGIARELYTTPLVMVALESGEYTDEGGKIKAPYFSLKVDDIEVNDKREISYLVLKDRKGKVRYSIGKKGTTRPVAADDVGDDDDVSPPAPTVEQPKTRKKKDTPAPNAETPTDEDPQLAEISTWAKVLTKGMTVQEKVAWAKANIEPIIGSINYTGLKDKEKTTALHAKMKELHGALQAA